MQLIPDRSCLLIAPLAWIVVAKAGNLRVPDGREPFNHDRFRSLHEGVGHRNDAHIKIVNAKRSFRFADTGRVFTQAFE